MNLSSCYGPAFWSAIGAVRFALALCVGTVLMASCHDAAPSVDDAFVLAGDPLAELPSSLSEIELFDDPSDRSVLHSRAVSFTPAHQLWTNGSEKERVLVLPEGALVDTSTDPWTFPPGTLFFKTFSYRDANMRSWPVETRVLRRGVEDWQYAVYLWNQEGTDAISTDGRVPLRVPVVLGEEAFEHEVPSTLQCRSCHESRDSTVLGFDELRLNTPLEGSVEGSRNTQLEELFARGILSDLPEPTEIVADDDLTRSVLSYFEGNCTHCHNGSDGPSSAFSLEHGVALGNLIDVAATSELAFGFRVRPAMPEESVLFLAMSRAEVTTAQPMPPVGVERMDEEGIEMVRRWIVSLEPLSDEAKGSKE